MKLTIEQCDAVRRVMDGLKRKDDWSAMMAALQPGLIGNQPLLFDVLRDRSLMCPNGEAAADAINIFEAVLQDVGLEIGPAAKPAADSSAE